MFLRGTHNGWTSQVMNCNAGIWEITVNSGGNHQFKFDVLGDWSKNVGDSNYDFIADKHGGNIQVPADPGNYRVTFNDRTRVYTIEMM